MSKLMPTHCPHCGFALDGHVKPHCEGRTCGWVVCDTCSAKISRTGHCCGPTRCADPRRWRDDAPRGTDG